eukprot:TRINITY_DN6062_c0_g2_i1.p1 TRINITY_DN6062_c0_g2~~TRINITY_DN6062_c0_g2_i1.p1  ORF type:complete len:255 (+),score=76.56 TRINITY_DN6062_c0_g2_i1:173-937(+)
MLRSLVGSEMCIRDSSGSVRRAFWSSARKHCTIEHAAETAKPIVEAAGTQPSWSQLTTVAGRGPVTVWLFFSGAVVFGMVILGGVTRLTHSGLSMTYWKPQQILPPITEAEWEEEFDKYKQFPEYQELNPDMVLSEFKPIFYFEYGHRLLGRAIGVLFAVPATYFAMKGYIKGPLGIRLAALFTMGGAQGAIGWWMVKSGLESSTCKSTGDDNIVRVSPVSYTHLRAHETPEHLVCRLLLEKKKKNTKTPLNTL